MLSSSTVGCGFELYSQQCVVSLSKTLSAYHNYSSQQCTQMYKWVSAMLGRYQACCEEGVASPTHNGKMGLANSLWEGDGRPTCVLRPKAYLTLLFLQKCLYLFTLPVVPPGLLLCWGTEVWLWLDYHLRNLWVVRNDTSKLQTEIKYTAQYDIIIMVHICKPF